MPKKILILNHSLRTDFFKKIKVELERRKKDVFIFYGPSKVDDFSVKNDVILLPNPQTLIKKKVNYNFNKKLEELEKNNSKSLNHLLIACERDLGFHYRSGNYIFSPTMNYNKLKKEHFISSLNYCFELVERVFNKIKPDMIVSGSTNPLYHAFFFLISKKLKIPIFINRRSKILFNRFYWTQNYNMYNDNIKTFKKKTKVSEFSKNYIKQFRNKQVTVSYIKQNWNKHSKFLTVQFRNLVNIGIHNLASIFYKKHSQLLFFSRVNFFLNLIKNKFTVKPNFVAYSEKELKNLKYLYFPLHKEPELALNFLAPHLSNQLELIKFLSMSLPIGYKLFIKEHRLNQLRRPSFFFKKLANFYNVEIISPFDDQFKYIKNAKAIITNNGTSGWEGILLDIPVINLADSFYDIIAKNKIENISKIDIVIQRILFDKKKKTNAK